MKHVLTGLMDTQVCLPQKRTERFRESNPVVTSQLRHERVKERRRLKDHAHQKALTEQNRRTEIQCRAKEMMKREEEERKRRERLEEESIKTHMVTIKKQMREQQERERYVINKGEGLYMYSRSSGISDVMCRFWSDMDLILYMYVGGGSFWKRRGIMYM